MEIVRGPNNIIIGRVDGGVKNPDTGSLTMTAWIISKDGKIVTNKIRRTIIGFDEKFLNLYYIVSKLNKEETETWRKKVMNLELLQEIQS